MKGTEAYLGKYIAGVDSIIIPIYQRQYSWKKDNCNQLYNDLVKTIATGRRHFFGSIVAKLNANGVNTTSYVIDGQQRLTTISLMILALMNLYKLNDEQDMAAKLKAKYLVDSDDNIRMNLLEVDYKVYKEFFDETIDINMIEKTSRLKENYDFFYQKIQDDVQHSKYTLKEMYVAICNLQIISIVLDADDDPQLIFESLNSTGLDLTEGDKIRNYILMGLDVKLQKDYYNIYWKKIEVNTATEVGNDVSMFIRDYLSIKQQEIASKAKIYLAFKQFVEDDIKDKKILLEDLLQYSRYYDILLRPTEKKCKNDIELCGCIKRLNRLETTITRPFFLEVLRLSDEGVINANEIREIFLTTESYVFRRTICNLPTNALNKIFLSLNREITTYEDNAENYNEKFKFALLQKGNNRRFPNDSEFAKALSERDIYIELNQKNKAYLFDRLENSNTHEKNLVFANLDSGNYSIEHIMPQHLTPAWQAALGKDYARIHETWLHRLANLTITAYNSKYSNSTFADKKNMKDGFKDSGLRLNQVLIKNSQWTEAELEQRNQYLQEQAIKVWEYPHTSFTLRRQDLEFVTLDDDEILTGRELVKFQFEQAEFTENTWIGMLEKMLRMLYDRDKTILYHLADVKEGEDFAYCFARDKGGIVSGKPLEIAVDLYAERNTGTMTKINLLRKLFKKYGLEKTSLTFYLAKNR